MKTLFSSFSLILIFLFFTAVAYLSTAGLETSKFNNLIEKEIQKKNPKIQLELKKIKIKLDIKKIQLFLSTNNPKVIYQNIKIPVTKIKVYTKISKILNSKIELTQIVFGIKEFKIQDVQKISTRIKPSNFKTYLLNNLNGGEIEKALFNLSIDKNFKLNDYKASGSIKKLNSKISNNVVIKNISFNFIIDNNLTLINSINASYNGFSISNGSLDLQQKKEIEITGKLNTQFDMSKKQLNKFFTNFNFFKENKIDIQGFLLHDFYLKIGKNYKIIDYNYESSGNISQSKVTLKKKFQNRFIKKPIEKIFLEKIKLEISYNKKNKKKLLSLNGFYSLDKLNYKKFKIKHNLNNKNPNYLIDMNLVENIFFDEINFQSDSSKKNNIKVDYSVKNKKHFFKSINFSEDKNLISIKGLLLNNKNEIEKLSSVKILTFKNNKENNNFVIKFRKKISIIGETYDSSNLINLLSGPTNSNPLKNFSKEVEVQIKNLITKSQIPLNNFNLIGLIEKGKFNKISAKSEFSKEKFLDISLKKNIDNKKLLEVYSDSPKAILGNYKFFEGIKGGKLLYNSAIGETNSISKLTIENFKVIKAPAFATLLTLADLGGVADLLSGKGMSFDILEIKFKEDPELTVIQEILALGSSVSLHMNGYLEKKTGLVSLSGTLVPAKTLNRLVSKIPLVGNILVGDKVGEGVFGVSFKIKGLPGKVKTTVNPVKSITPRFITRALEKMKTK